MLATKKLAPTLGGGNYDAFITKLNSTRTAFIYSTYLGGSNDDIGNAIAVDSSGNPYLTKLNATGTALVYSTYLGG